MAEQPTPTEEQKAQRAKELTAEAKNQKALLKKSDRQVAMVFDLNKCLGCQTCTVACKTLWTREEGMEYMWWATVNTMPGKGTPKDWEKMGGGFRSEEPQSGKLPTKADFGEAWDFNYDEVFFGGKGNTVHLQPSGNPEWGPNWDEDQGAGQYPNSFYFYLQRICNHCTNPACLEACPRNAIYKRKEDGIVLISEDRCKGYRFCMEACPFKKIYFNHARQISQKCIFCFPRVEKGVAPACARQCPGRLRFVGFLDDENGPIYKLVKKYEVALPLHPEQGTQPNVYYVPPISPPRFDAEGNIDESKPRIPTEYLKYLFGDKVEKSLETIKAEMAKTKAGGKSELLDILIVYEWKSLFAPFTKDPAELEPRKA
jgi:ethylbenzene hydroxylase subunit beta/complex iron-sulfur molybdoenzyme family reductase subunit beta